MKHPIQKPIEDETGVWRFTENKLVSFLVDNYGLNELAKVRYKENIDAEDWYQLMQLIGYSISGAPIPYDVKDIAESMMENKLSETEAKIKYYEELIFNLRKSLRDPVAELYEKHPDDLMEIE